jgi:hypothetical protein
VLHTGRDLDLDIACALPQVVARVQLVRAAERGVVVLVAGRSMIDQSSSFYEP